MKLAIVGGSAASTPHLFAVPEVAALGNELQVCLIGRSEDNLRSVQRAIRIVAGNGSLRIDTATDFSGLDGASIVLLQARYGGYQARARDETFPLNYGVCGDEGLGPGGLASAWRSWPEVSRALDAVAARCKKARVLLMTAPLSLLVRSARHAFPDLDIYGICELPWATLLAICRDLKVPESQVEFNYAGINHLGWFDGLRSGDVDLLERYAEARLGDEFPSADLIRSVRAFPLKYLKLHYFAGDELRRQRHEPPRAVELQEIQQSALQRFACDGKDRILDVLHHRPAPWYSLAVGPFIAGTAGVRTSTIFFLSCFNEGYVTDADPLDVVERPFQLVDGQLLAVSRSQPLSEALASTLVGYLAYERAAAHALLENRLSDCLSILSLHPWVSHCGDLNGLATALIAAI